MNLLKSAYAAPLFLSLILCSILCAAALYARPLFPVDETRYLSVAWEMHQSGNWVLPTLNFEPYHHKPPVLFWLINLLWAVFGVSQSAAMIVPYLAGMAVLLLTARLGTRLFPKTHPLLVTSVLGGMLPFVIYTNLIMFDLLLTVAVLIGVTAIWDFFKTGEKRHLAILSLAVGAGALIKGPVILLHLLPLMLLVKFWANRPLPMPTRKVAGGVVLALIGGVLIGLCWAIPAAIEGGKEFAEKIFYGQTAGRMVNAFDHKRPVFWYLTFIPLFFLPWALSPAFWAGLQKWKAEIGKGEENTPVLKFLLCWIIPVFIGFSLISGKQVHYLLPLLPPLALLITGSFLTYGSVWKKCDIALPFLGVILLSILPLALHSFAPDIAAKIPTSVHIGDSFGAIWTTPSLIVTVLTIIAAIAVIMTTQRALLPITLSIAMCMTLAFATFQISAKTGFFRNYDLAEMGTLLNETPGRPLAFLGGYNGELSFIARRTQPVEILPEKSPSAAGTWFKTHPDGQIVVFTRAPESFAGYTTLYSTPYKMTNTYLILEQKKQKRKTTRR